MTAAAPRHVPEAPGWEWWGILCEETRRTLLGRLLSLLAEEPQQSLARIGRAIGACPHRAPSVGTVLTQVALAHGYLTKERSVPGLANVYDLTARGREVLDWCRALPPDPQPTPKPRLDVRLRALAAELDGSGPATAGGRLAAGCVREAANWVEEQYRLAAEFEPPEGEPEARYVPGADDYPDGDVIF